MGRELNRFQIEQGKLLARAPVAADLYLCHLRKPRGIFSQERDVFHERRVARVRELGGDLARLIALCGAEVEHGFERDRRGDARMRIGHKVVHVFRIPVVAPCRLFFRIHPLLNDRPRAAAREKERVMIELESVLHERGIHLGAHHDAEVRLVSADCLLKRRR